MTSNPFQIPLNIEQDSSGGDNLPSYDHLAQQSGPNSRFGRWREWVEKRAAERYADITPEERSRRRERGWEELHDQPFPSTLSVPADQQVIHDSPRSLHVQTDFTESETSTTATASSPPLPPLPQLTISSPLPLVSQTLEPTHLLTSQFGSRFLPHTMSPIRCLLPLASDRLLLIGHDEGLSVLNMFPQGMSEEGEVIHKGPDEAQARLIWEGEGVFQMSILEEEVRGESGPHGVVLALVGPTSSSSPFSKESESIRSLRMYSLSSLLSLAKWTLSQPHGYLPLDLHHSQLTSQQPHKKHRHQGSITRSLKSIIDPSSASLVPDVTTYSDMLTPSSPCGPTPLLQNQLNPHSKHQNSGDSSWDIIDELPLRWATDFVPLASAGSRLTRLSVRCYALWRDETTMNTRGGTTLAVATKSNIWLYETPRGERAFRFIKDFYTPMQPRHMAFIQQSVQDIIRRPSETIGIPARFQQPNSGGGGSSSSSSSYKRSDSTAATLRGLPPTTTKHSFLDLSASSSSSAFDGTQRGLFIIFDKKAGWIRLSDSVVGEIDLHDGGLADFQPMRDPFVIPGPSGARSRRSSLGYTHKGQWIPPVRVDLPIHSGYGKRKPTATRSIYLLTRGKQTHLLPCPLPTNVSTCPAFRILYWESVPTSVTARVCIPNDDNGDVDIQPVLQIIGLGEGGVEVQEITLSSWGKGKGKASSGDLVRSQADLGGDTGFLCHGGCWDDPQRELASHLSRSKSFLSDETLTSHDGLGPRGPTTDQGIYAWCRKGTHDWRVFWLGGPLKAEQRQDTI